jgi:hypothetical protein
MSNTFLQILADGGPIYTETNLKNIIVEPFNALSALVFLGMSIYWFFKLRGNFSRFSFLTISLILLTIGGVGGTIYHAFRNSSFFLFMDWLPIVILCVMVSIYFQWKVFQKWHYVIIIFLSVLIIERLIWYFIPVTEEHLRSNVNYTIMGAMVFLSTRAFLKINNYYQWPLVLYSLIAFSFALFFRIADNWMPIPIGTHFLWHIFGAIAGNFMFLFIYRVTKLELNITF